MMSLEGTTLRLTVTLVMLAGCGDVRLADGDGTGGTGALDPSAECAEAREACTETCCDADLFCFIARGANTGICMAPENECALEESPCIPEMNAEGRPLAGSCCNPRHTCFPVGGGDLGVCAYVAPENACAASSARCVPEFNADGLPTRGDCCLSRQTCFPSRDSSYGFCEY